MCENIVLYFNDLADLGLDENDSHVGVIFSHISQIVMIRRKQQLLFMIRVVVFLQHVLPRVAGRG